ncbi:MAG TPA: T9SS type A sorting domain-containing protein, partial [Flavisolibacter sp.]
FAGLYPNPATVGLVLTLQGRAAGPLDVQVVNAAGQTVFSRRYAAGTNNLTLNTASLAPGTYRVVLKADGQVQATSLLLTR